MRVPGFLELRGVEQGTTVVTLVASGIIISTLRARAHDVPVRQELVQRSTVQLLIRACGGVALAVDGGEDRLADRGLCPAETELCC